MKTVKVVNTKVIEQLFPTPVVLPAVGDPGELQLTFVGFSGQSWTMTVPKGITALTGWRLEYVRW